jgi:restriction system protein
MAVRDETDEHCQPDHGLRITHYVSMSTHTFAFEPPRWRSPNHLHMQTGALFVGSVIWVALYGWLGYRLWTNESSHGFGLNLALAILCVGFGVVVVLSWRTLGKRWRLRLRPPLGDKHGRALTLAQLQALTPSEFEEYIARRIFERQGYQVVNVRDTKDGGVDVLLTDPKGRQAVVQCKRYRQNVGEPIVRDLYGTMIHAGATHAYLITTAGFSAEAKRWAMGKPITLIDGRQLVELAKADP